MTLIEDVDFPALKRRQDHGFSGNSIAVSNMTYIAAARAAAGRFHIARSMRSRTRASTLCVTASTSAALSRNNYTPCLWPSLPRPQSCPRRHGGEDPCPARVRPPQYGLTMEALLLIPLSSMRTGQIVTLGRAGNRHGKAAAMLACANEISFDSCQRPSGPAPRSGVRFKISPHPVRRLYPGLSSSI